MLRQKEFDTPLNGAARFSRRSFMTSVAALSATAFPALQAWSQTSNSTRFGKWGIELQHISKTVSPGDDFFTYANEGWLRTASMPPGYTLYNEMNGMFLRNEQEIGRIVRGEGTYAAFEGRQKLGGLYDSYRDVKTLDRLGVSPIKPGLDKILSLQTPEEVAAWMAHPMSHTISGIYVFVDLKDTNTTVVHLDQQTAGRRIMGLPNPNYYQAQEPPFPEHRRAYAEHIAAMLRHAGIDRVEERAAAIIALETRLAAAQWPAERLRDRVGNYHPMPRAELETFAPGFPWGEFLKARGIGPIDRVVVNTDTAIQASARIFAQTPVDVWKSYLAFHWIQNHAGYLSSAFREASYDFFERRLGGQKQLRSRESRALQFVSAELRGLVGLAYISRNFPAHYRERMEMLAAYIKRGFSDSLSGANWLDDATRKTALEKLSSLTLRLGYPDDLEDYSNAEIVQGDLIGNLHRLRLAAWERERGLLGKSKDAWGGWNPALAPQSVDGSYSPQLNAVTFPAGLLQAPAFDFHADEAVNFGAIGAVLAHEIGHGFDDQGSRFDQHGNLREWWSSRSRREYDARAQQLIRQHSAYEALPGVRLRGAQTVGEDIADLLGVYAALQGYRLYLKEKAAGTAPVLDGFSGPQRFFLGWAQMWRALETPGALRANLTQSTHSPPRFRVNGVVRNLDEWHDAFGIEPGHALYLAPAERVRFW